MNEVQWRTATDHVRMIRYLRIEHDVTRTKAGRRKLRLFACSCCRLLAWHLPIPAGVRECVETAERYADDESDADDLRRLWVTHFGTPDSVEQANAEKAMIETTREKVLDAVRWTPYFLQSMKGAARPARPTLPIEDVVRHVFGNPFRAQPVEAWLAWNNRAVPRIAQAIYAEHRFTDLPILADALEEAGCTDVEILDHCRDKGEHARGCWVVDRMLGKADYRKAWPSRLKRR